MALSLKWRKPHFDKKDKITLSIIFVFAFWFEMMLLPFYATSMPMMQIGEELPTTPAPEVTYNFNWEYYVTIEKVEEDGKIFGVIDPSYPVAGIVSGATLFFLNRFHNWWKSRRDNSD